PAQQSKYWGDYDLKPYSAASRDFYNYVLAPAYLKQKDTTMAALAIFKSGSTPPFSLQYYSSLYSGNNIPEFWQRHLHSYHLKKILGWSGQKNRSAYLKLLMGEIDKKTTISLYELLGTAYLREHNYTAAANTYKRVSKRMKNYFNNGDSDDGYPAPFVSQI